MRNTPVVARVRAIAVTLGLAATVATVDANDFASAVDASPSVEQFDLVSPMSGDENFGETVLVLSNGNYVVVDDGRDDGAIADTGAVFLYDGDSDTVISVLSGSTAGDEVGSGGLVEVGGGDFVVVSPHWDNGAISDVGAVTFVDGQSGLDGPVTTTNSLHGTHADDMVGGFSARGVRLLTNGNYVVRSPHWDNGAISDVGAVTFVDGLSGLTGPVTTANSLHGTQPGDFVGSGGATPLANGNYVVSSGKWNGGPAATWGNGTTGTTGPVTTANSLYGASGVTALANGNYVVSNAFWSNGTRIAVGAVVWGDGTTGTTGPVTTTNSLHGTSTSDTVGCCGGVTALANGNYVVSSPFWDNGVIADAGAIVWGNGSTGTTGPVTTTNSLHGTISGDIVGSQSVIALTNGNYIVNSPRWDNGLVINAGAVTWGNGTTGITGPVTTANSLHGTQPQDSVGRGDFYFRGAKALVNGNYVVSSPGWDNGSIVNAGAVTWGNGATGITGPVTTANSLHGTQAGDLIGFGRGENVITALTNGNYVVSSPRWDNGSIVNAGAATWGNGATGITGPVTTANSLHGTQPGDFVGSDGSVFDDEGVVGLGGVAALDNGNYVVASRDWDDGALVDVGAATFGNGTSGTTGPITASNSVIGAPPGVVKVPGGALTSNDAVVIPTTQDRVLLMRLDLAPAFPSPPPDIAVAAAPGASTALIEYSTPVAEDLRDSTTPPVTCLPMSGSSFPIGRTTVTCAATDSQGSTGTESFVVTVMGPDLFPLTPTRLVDTRPGNTTIDDQEAGSGPIRGGSQIEVQIAGRGHIPANADAVAINVVAINPTSRGFLTIHPCGTQPNTASLNYAATGDVVGNEIITELSPTGTICIYTSATTNLTVDAVAYTAGSKVMSFTPTRLLDTRPGQTTIDSEESGAGTISAGSEIEVQIAGRGPIPADADAIVVNVVAINPDRRGFLTIHPCGTRPNAASLNYESAGDVIGNEVIAQLSATGTICIYSSATTHLTADAVAHLPGGTDIQTVTPARLLDTRPGGTTIDRQEAGAGTVAASTEIEVQIAGRDGVPANADAVGLNVVAINPDRRGFLTIHPCGTRPNAASLNYESAGDVIGNEVIAQLSATGTICIFTSAATHLTADLVAHLPTSTG